MVRSYTMGEKEEENIVSGLVAILLVAGIFVLGASFLEHKRRMENDPTYRTKVVESQREAEREIRRFTDNCKWCYGR